MSESIKSVTQNTSYKCVITIYFLMSYDSNIIIYLYNYQVWQNKNQGRKMEEIQRGQERRVTCNIYVT